MCLPRDTRKPISGGGHDYPAVMLDGLALDPASAVIASGEAAEIDAELLRDGEFHVEAVRARADTWDGPILTYDRVEGGAVICRHSTYFAMLATSGALGAELAGADRDASLADLPLRRRAAALADGDPISSGRGRAAAVGLNVAVVATGGRRRRALVGRRSSRMAALPGLWSFVAGNIEPGDGERPLVSAIVRELSEELPALGDDDARSLAARSRIVGASMSLGRLGPSILVATEIDAEVDDLGTLAADEFDAQRVIDLDDPADAWRGLTPRTMVPASAALLAALGR